MEFPDQILELVSSFLSFGDTHIICQQFDRVWRPNKQVLWNGVKGFREVVQKWADKNELQTLTTVMGSLSSKSNPSYGRNGGDKRSNYMKGASALFAWYISKGDKVTVLALPPDENGDRFNPSPYTNYRGIEEPIVKGRLGNKAVGEMLILHPTLPGAEKFFYPLWPMDGQKAMKAILDTKGRGVWNWRTPSPSKKAKSCLDSILTHDSNNADKCIVSGVAMNMEQGGKGNSIQGAPKATPSTPTTNNQKPIPQMVAKRPEKPSDCPHNEQTTLTESDIILWLGNKNKIRRVSAALRTVLAADEIGLGRAKSKLELLLKEVYSLMIDCIQERKAAGKSSDEGSPKATVEAETLIEQADQKDCCESRQTSLDVAAALLKAERKKEKSRRKKEEEKKRKEDMEKQKDEGKVAENPKVDISKAEMKKQKKERKKEKKRKGKEVEKQKGENNQNEENNNNEAGKTAGGSTVNLPKAGKKKNKKKNKEERSAEDHLFIHEELSRASCTSM